MLPGGAAQDRPSGWWHKTWPSQPHEIPRRIIFAEEVICNTDRQVCAAPCHSTPANRGEPCLHYVAAAECLHVHPRRDGGSGLGEPLG